MPSIVSAKWFGERQAPQSADSEAREAAVAMNSVSEGGVWFEEAWFCCMLPALDFLGPRFWLAEVSSILRLHHPLGRRGQQCDFRWN